MFAQSWYTRVQFKAEGGGCLDRSPCQRIFSPNPRQIQPDTTLHTTMPHCSHQTLAHVKHNIKKYQQQNSFCYSDARQRISMF